MRPENIHAGNSMEGHWPRPDGEHRDAFLQNIASRLHALRRGRPGSGEYVAELKDVADVLAKRKDFVRDRELWTELYQRAVMAYPFKRHLIRLPFINVTKHNHVVTFYMGLRPSPEIPLVHWDTHSDLSPIQDSNMLVQALAGGDGLRAQKLCHDIGAAMTGVLLLPGKPRDMVWVTPSWVPDPEDSIRYWKHMAGSRNTVLAHCNAKKDHPLSSVRLYHKQTPCEGNSGVISTINLSRGARTAKLNRLLTLVGQGPYLMDVDLDYFVCNGRPLRRDLYLKEGYDVCSTHRCRMKELNDTPRDMFNKRARQCYDMQRSFRKEAGLIEARLKAFEGQLRFLKKHGRVPCAVSISDSTGATFTDCVSCIASGNEYMPNYYAAFVNGKVVSILERVFSGMAHK